MHCLESYSTETCTWKADNFLNILGQLCSDVMVPESNRKIFFDLLSDLKKGLKRSADKQVRIFYLCFIIDIKISLIYSDSLNNRFS